MKTQKDDEEDQTNANKLPTKRTTRDDDDAFWRYKKGISSLLSYYSLNFP